MKTRMKGGDRRAAIITEAVRLFAAKGFRGVTTRELAAAVGVTEPVIYQHFATKSDLYRAIIEQKMTEAGGRSGKLAELAAGTDDLRFFTQLATQILDTYKLEPDFMRLLFFSALEGHELSDLFLRRYIVEFYELVSGYIRQRIKAGEFRPVDPAVATRTFIGMVSYHGLVELLFRTRLIKASRAKLIRQMVDTFLSGLLVHPNSCNANRITDPDGSGGPSEI